MTGTLTRRAFVGAALSLGAFSRNSSASEVDAPVVAETKRSALTLGVASYSCRKFTLDQTLDMARALGITHMVKPQVAEMMQNLHPLRLQYEAFSSRNPFMAMARR